MNVTIAKVDNKMNELQHILIWKVTMAYKEKEIHKWTKWSSAHADAGCLISHEIIKQVGTCIRCKGAWDFQAFKNILEITE